MEEEVAPAVADGTRASSFSAIGFFGSACSTAHSCRFGARKQDPFCDTLTKGAVFRSSELVRDTELRSDCSLVPFNGRGHASELTPRLILNRRRKRVLFAFTLTICVMRRASLGV